MSAVFLLIQDGCQKESVLGGPRTKRKSLHYLYTVLGKLRPH